MSLSRNKQADCKSGYQGQSSGSTTGIRTKKRIVPVLCSLRMRGGIPVPATAVFTAVFAAVPVVSAAGAFAAVFAAVHVVPAAVVLSAVFAAVPLVPDAAVFTATFAVSAAAAFVAVPVVPAAGTFTAVIVFVVNP
jgi:hypothetical protein